MSCAVENDDATGDTAWTLRIDGKLLDDEKRTYTSKRKFSSFLRRMYVEFNGNGSADEAAAKPAEWQRSASVGDSDGFDLTRTSSGGVPAGHVDAKILLHLMHSPAKFELKKELADMIGLFHATRHEAIAALWQYIKERKLQDREEPEWINCDDYMQRVFPGVARMKYGMMMCIFFAVYGSVLIIYFSLFFIFFRSVASHSLGCFYFKLHSLTRVLCAISVTRPYCCCLVVCLFVCLKGSRIFHRNWTECCCRCRRSCCTTKYRWS